MILEKVSKKMSQSQKLRHMIYVLWQHTDAKLLHEDFYNAEMEQIQKMILAKIDDAKFHRDGQRGPDTLSNNMTRVPKGF